MFNFYLYYVLLMLVIWKDSKSGFQAFDKLSFLWIERIICCKILIFSDVDKILLFSKFCLSRIIFPPSLSTREKYLLFSMLLEYSLSKNGDYEFPYLKESVMGFFDRSSYFRSRRSMSWSWSIKSFYFTSYMGKRCQGWLSD